MVVFVNIQLNTLLKATIFEINLFLIQLYTIQYSMFCSDKNITCCSFIQKLDYSMVTKTIFAAQPGQFSSFYVSNFG